MNNDFLKSLAAFGMEGLNSEAIVADEYASSECAEERIELDNLDNIETAMESMSDAIHETGLEAQSLALEAAGFTLENAVGFTGELSTESITNAAKRGYYEVKIQIKKAAQKIWKLILSVLDNLVGSEGRFKSYSKLFKKYKERLGKVYPKDKKDGESREITIRDWTGNNTANVESQVRNFISMCNIEDFKQLRAYIKALDIKDVIRSAAGMVGYFYTELGGFTSGTNNPLSGLSLPTLRGNTLNDLQEFEKALDEYDGKANFKDVINDSVDHMKDIDTKEVKIEDAKSELQSLAGRLETLTNRDIKFKSELQKLKKTWDKKFGSWDLKDMPTGTDARDERKEMVATVLRILSKLGKGITGYRMMLSKIYSAVASNLQGVLADMAKVIAKGTNIGA